MRRNIRKPVPAAGLAIFSLLLSFCGTRQNQVEIIYEDGVEVIINHLKSYEIKGEPNRFRLEREFSIDLEDDRIAELGLTSIINFDIDDDGNIFFTDARNPDSYIFKFDRSGSFISTFGRIGQGPEETQWPNKAFILKDIIVLGTVQKILFFSTDGEFLKEIPREGISGRYLIPLENGSYVSFEVFRGNSDLGYIDRHILSLIDSEFQKHKELARMTRPYPSKGEGYKAVFPFLSESVCGGRIYIGNSETGSYEIRIFDLYGRLVRKIRKEYQPVKISAAEKKARIERIRLSPEYMKTVYCPDYFPPYQRMIFTDDRGRLFVMTYEKGENPREYVYDIFNSDGAFIGRMLLDNGGSKDRLFFPFPVLSKHGRLYMLREKESGYHEFIVSKMIWE